MSTTEPNSYVSSQSQDINFLRTLNSELPLSIKSLLQLNLNHGCLKSVLYSIRRRYNGVKVCFNENVWLRLWRPIKIVYDKHNTLIHIHSGQRAELNLWRFKVSVGNWSNVCCFLLVTLWRRDTVFLCINYHSCFNNQSKDRAETERSQHQSLLWSKSRRHDDLSSAIKMTSIQGTLL